MTDLATVEGSSHLTAVHDLLKIKSADVPYDEQVTASRTLGGTDPYPFGAKCLRFALAAATIRSGREIRIYLNGSI